MSAFGGKVDMPPPDTSPYYDGVASAFGTIFAVFPSCTSAILDAIRRDVRPTLLFSSLFSPSQICPITSIQGVATSSDPSFAFFGSPRAFELALLLLGRCD